MIPRERVWEPTGDPAHDLFIKTLYDACCRHLVHISIEFERKEPKGDCRDCFDSGCSAFVLKVGDRWILATAGHFLKDIDDQLADGTYHVSNCWMASFFGPTTKSGLRTPFPFREFHQIFINDRNLALDFGFIFLPHLYIEWLKSEAKKTGHRILVWSPRPLRQCHRRQDAEPIADGEKDVPMKVNPRLP